MVDTTNLRRIEYTILGTIIDDGKGVGEVVAKLAPEDFTSPGGRGLFEAVSALHFRGAPIDPVTVLQEAGRDYEVVVDEVRRYWIAPSNMPYYCDMLRDARKLMEVQAEAVTITAAENLDEARTIVDRLNGMMVTKKNVEILSASQAALDFYRRNEETAKPEYLTWGIEKLDKCLYVDLGDFVVVGGYPSAGKTLLSLQFAAQWAKKYRVGFFSLETSPQKLTDRLMSHLSKVPLKKLKTRDLHDADWAALAEASVKMGKMQLDFIDAGGMSVRDVQAVALNKRYQIILVDYLQLMVDKAKNRYEQVTNISQGLHTLARSNGITVVALAQLSRPDKSQGKPQPPTMSSFRESGQIEQDADVALLLWPADINDNRSRRVLKVGKNKEGDRVRLELDFDGSTQTMTTALPNSKEKSKGAKQNERAPGQVSFTEMQGEDPELPF